MARTLEGVALAIGVGALAAYAVAFAVVEWVRRRQPVRRDASTGRQPWTGTAPAVPYRPRWLFEHEDDEGRYS